MNLRVFLNRLAVLSHLESHEPLTVTVGELNRAVLVFLTVAILNEITELIDRLIVEAVAHQIDVESLFASLHVCHRAYGAG